MSDYLEYLSYPLNILLKLFRNPADDIWINVATEEMIKYDGMLKLKEFVLFSAIIFDICGDHEYYYPNLTEDKKKLLFLIDKKISSELLKTDLEYLPRNFDEYFIDYGLAKKNHINPYIFVKEKSKLKWGKIHYFGYFGVYFGESHGDILLIYPNDRGGAIFLESNGYYVFAERYYGYSWIFYNNKKLWGDEDGFQNGYTFDDLSIDFEEAFEILLNACNPYYGEYSDFLSALVAEDLNAAEKFLPGEDSDIISKALMNSCQIGYTDAIKLILRYFEWSPEVSADCVKIIIENGNLDSLKYLVSIGTSLDILGPQKPLVIAARNNDTEMIKFLVASGEDINYRKGSIGTPLYNTIPRAYEAAKLLIDLGADINRGAEFDEKYYGFRFSTPLRYAYMNYKNDDRIFNLLLSLGAKGESSE